MNRFSETRKVALLAGVVLALIPVETWASVPSEQPTFSDPLNITNRYMPFQPGGLKVYTFKEEDIAGVAVDIYLTEPRTFVWNGTEVQCRILESLEFEEGELMEISRNFFAQADDGTVYYFGEIVEMYEGGVVWSRMGSWLVGGPSLLSDPFDTSTAEPTVFMPGNPEVGDRFKPQDVFPIVDETDEVKGVGISVTVPGGVFEDAIEILETTRLDPESKETKWYAPGVGLVKGVDGEETLVLVASTLPAAVQTGIDSWKSIR